VVFFGSDLELFTQCGIFGVRFRTVHTVWYFMGQIWNCSHSVVFLGSDLELFTQCGIFGVRFRTVHTVWDFVGQI
jgi:hypothetical protein